MRIYERRLQILIDEPRYRRLSARARQRNVSVAEIVREAIDMAIAAETDERARAARRILEAEPMPVPQTIDALKRELGEVRGGNL